ncbi:MAG: sodium:alanine symporter family protein [Erysipelotrichaceae bacterium]|nr:sodium:alanine symporter family protein [Erysipelotrichaceae bacterium]
MIYIEQVVDFLNDILWGPPMIFLLTGTHIWMTWKTGIVQRYVFKGIKLSVSKDPDAQGDISPFAALTTALASTIGTGNIIGVATAIVSGGPGAVLWTWLVGVLGIATKYAESLIAIKYRKKLPDGSYIGGAMTALEHLNLKGVGILFALLTGVCAFGIGCGVQSNAIADVIYTNYKIPVVITAFVIAVLTAIVILGGVKSISTVCEKLVPFMSLFYVLGCVYILYYNRAYLGDTISLIITSAFTPRAAMGGFVGSTIMVAARYGIARGLFSNESGMGSAPIVAAASQSRNSVRTALISSTGVFWDTVVVCLVTGLVLVSSIIANDAVSSVGLEGGQLASLTFAQIPVVGTPLLVFGVMTFAFSTILGWYYYGERSVVYLFGNKASFPYRLLWVVFAFLGAVLNLALVWKIADALNALMAIPNLIAVLLLSNLIVKETKYYLHEDRLDERDPELK